MERLKRDPGQALYDAIALKAQEYVGYFSGHPTRAKQWSAPIIGSTTIDATKPWREPNVIRDDCEFCERLTDEDVERRIVGFQAAIDKEVLSGKWSYLDEWLRCQPDSAPLNFFHKDTVVWVESPDGDHEVHPRDIDRMRADWHNRRVFIEREQDRPRTAASGPRDNGWDLKALPMVDLPLRLKRKLCIEWNHVYRDYLRETGYSYDFETHEFYSWEESPKSGPIGCDVDVPDNPLAGMYSIDGI